MTVDAETSNIMINSLPSAEELVNNTDAAGGTLVRPGSDDPGDDLGSQAAVWSAPLSPWLTAPLDLLDASNDYAFRLAYVDFVEPTTAFWGTAGPDLPPLAAGGGGVSSGGGANAVQDGGGAGLTAADWPGPVLAGAGGIVGGCPRFDWCRLGLALVAPPEGVTQGQQLAFDLDCATGEDAALSSADPLLEVCTHPSSPSQGHPHGSTR